jgi:negative regulator of sigma E activity
LVPGSKQPVVHYVVSDGLTTVSVIIEQQDNARAAEGFSNVGGSTWAYSTPSGPSQITAIGEAPRPTLRSIGLSFINR